MKPQSYRHPFHSPIPQPPAPVSQTPTVTVSSTETRNDSFLMQKAGHDPGIPELCRHFLSFYKPAFTYERDELRRQLRAFHFEQVVGDPQQAMRDAPSFTGISIAQIDANRAPQTGHVNAGEMAASSAFSLWATEMSGKRPSADRVGNYANVLMSTETAQVEEGCAEFDERFGYQQRAA